MPTPDPISQEADLELVTRAVRRARRRLLPFLLLMYVACYLDRANIGYAKQAFQAAVGVSDTVFAFGAGIFFLSYALLEVPSNLILHRVGARTWLARIMVTWGLISAGMVFAKGDRSFCLIRLLLGGAEAGFFPGAILYLTYWFPSRARGQLMATFYFGSPLALMLGGPLSGSLLDLDGTFGLAGWRWMFVTEGLMASAVGVWAFYYLTDRPANAHWMPIAEREALSREIAREESIKKGRGRISLNAVFRDPKLLHFVAIYFLIQVSGYGVAFYLPTQVSTLLGVRVGLLVGLVSAIPWACAIAVTAFWPGLAVRTGYRRSFAVLSLLAITIGLTLSANLRSGFAIAALCLATAGIISVQPIFWTFPTGYYGGIGAAAAIATVNALGNLGGFVAPTLKNWLESSLESPKAGQLFLGCAALFAAVLVAGLQEPEDKETCSTKRDRMNG